MPPDEHREHANNSIYTNLLANYAVNTARWTECLVSDETTSQETVPDAWLEKMKNLVFLFNEEHRYHEEYEARYHQTRPGRCPSPDYLIQLQGFDDEYETGTLDPRGIKQADVVLLGYPLMWDMPPDVRRNDLELYEPIMNPEGPAMTWGIYAIKCVPQS